ncbi:MAG: endolytic transglycosylase MltG [Alphaproteobacteria bacterium]|nr:endolytic transglycosylase MltG [Alphaproteobacteria bacterium]
MKVCLGLAVFVLLAGAGIGAGGWHAWTRPGPHGKDERVLLARGSGARDIAALLRAAGVIREPWVFLAAARLTAGHLQAGEYVVPAGLDMRGVRAMLVGGDRLVRRLTIPEGLTLQQVLRRLEAAEGLVGDLPQAATEGSLLPTTFYYEWGDGRRAMLARMQSAMAAALARLWPTRAADLALASLEDAVVLASIVERETAIDAERPRVAAVFFNRLARGMRLQSDPTVVYAVSAGAGVLARPLSKADLAQDHPYNTYTRDGLPPGPIASPGLASLAAVLNPAKSDELYFVADGSGGHVFARTLPEHNRNVARWRALQKEPGAGER